MRHEELASKIGEKFYEDLADKLQSFVNDAISRLSLVRRILNDDDTIELSYHELSGVTMAVNEAYSLLEMANKLYSEEEGKIMRAKRKG